VRQQILQLIDSKLAQAMREADMVALDRARQAWIGIGPSPTCPPVSAVMNAIHEALGNGYRERGRVAQNVIVPMLSSLDVELSETFVESILEVVYSAFKHEPYLSIALSTPGVYNRAMAPQSKFNARVFELEAALISVSAQNLTRNSVEAIKLAIDELAIRQKIFNNQSSSLTSKDAVIQQFFVSHSTIHSFQTGSGSATVQVTNFDDGDDLLRK
jgi:hypothetical protein